MAVFDRTVMDEVSVRIASRNDRDLAIEGDKAFEDCFTLPDRAPGIFELLWGMDSILTLTVVAEASGFENGREADFTGPRSEFRRACDAPECSYRESSIRQKRLLAQAVLGGVENRAAGANRSTAGGGRGRISRYILELKRYDRDAISEFADRIQVFIWSVDFYVCHLPGRCVLIRR